MLIAADHVPLHPFNGFQHLFPSFLKFNIGFKIGILKFPCNKQNGNKKRERKTTEKAAQQRLKYQHPLHPGQLYQTIQDL